MGIFTSVILRHENDVTVIKISMAVAQEMESNYQEEERGEVSLLILERLGSFYS